MPLEEDDGPAWGEDLCLAPVKLWRMILENVKSRVNTTILKHELVHYSGVSVVSEKFDYLRAFRIQANTILAE